MAHSIMQLHDISVPEFLEVLDSCKGNVYLEIGRAHV